MVITVGGDVDLHSAPKLAQALHAAASTYRKPYLILDMTHLSFIDSTGVGVLIHVQKRAQALGESLVLVHPPPLVRKLLLGTQLSRLFTAYDTLDDALAAISTT